MRHVLVTVAARAGNRWARRRVGEEPAQSQSAVGCDVSVRPVWQVSRAELHEITGGARSCMRSQVGWGQSPHVDSYGVDYFMLQHAISCCSMQHYDSPPVHHSLPLALYHTCHILDAVPTRAGGYG